MSNKTANKQSVKRIPNYCHALNLSVDKVTRLVVDELTKLDLRIVPSKIVAVLTLLTNEVLVDYGFYETELELSANNLQEHGLSRSMSYNYIKVIKGINEVLKKEGYMDNMSPWVIKRLNSIT